MTSPALKRIAFSFQKEGPSIWRGKCMIILTIFSGNDPYNE